MLNRRLALTLAAALFGLSAAPATPAQKPPDPTDSLVYITVSFEHPSGTIEKVSRGSGFIITESGYVLTAKHILPKDIPVNAKLVIRGATRSKDNVSYRLYLQETVPVAADVALLYFPKALPIKWPPLQIGETDNLTEGILVHAYGFPYDQEWVKMPGVITGPQGIDSTTLPTNAGFMEGMSGGPVLNAAGRVIGVIIGQANITTDLNYFTPLHHVQVLTDIAGATSGSRRTPTRRQRIPTKYPGVMAQITRFGASGAFITLEIAVENETAKATGPVCGLSQLAELSDQDTGDSWKAVDVGGDVALCHLLPV